MKGKTGIIAKFPRTDLVICSHSRKGKNPSNSQIRQWCFEHLNPDSIPQFDLRQQSPRNLLPRHRTVQQLHTCKEYGWS